MTPEFLELARYALFVERVAPFLADAESVLATPLPDEPGAKLAAAQRRIAAQRAVPAIRAALHLDEARSA